MWEVTQHTSSELLPCLVSDSTAVEQNIAIFFFIKCEEVILSFYYKFLTMVSWAALQIWRRARACEMLGPRGDTTC